MSEPIQESGLFASLRRMLATALEIAQVRLALVGTEIEFEKRRILHGLLWGAVALLVLGVGIVLSCGFVILLFWEGYRLAAVGVMALLFLAGGALLIRQARQRLRSPSGMFDASVAELQRDQAELRAASGQHAQG
jgi:uncharacterized membrane protein YqjE